MRWSKKRKEKNWPKNQHFVSKHVTALSPSHSQTRTSFDLALLPTSRAKRANFPRDFGWWRLFRTAREGSAHCRERPVRDDSWCTQSGAPVKLKVVESGLELSPLWCYSGVSLSHGQWRRGIVCKGGWKKEYFFRPASDSAVQIFTYTRASKGDGVAVGGWSILAGC